jgi:methylthioribose-1-phosphate isomerase
LPERAEFLELNTARATARAIADMVVRGAPAIGIAAAYGVVLAARHRFAQQGAAWRSLIGADLADLAASRPTAVNLFWALERMTRRLEGLGEGDPTPALLAEALAIHAEDIAANRRLGELGASLIQGPTNVITHCNAGALATGGHGTALGVIRQAFAAGKITQVFADETRPWLQGTRLTAWELSQDGIPVTLQADGAAASLMAGGGIGWVIVGADRIAANGDVANKIGTYGLAVLARYHGIGFMVAAPTSTIDWDTPSGAAIPIEERAPGEVLACGGKRLGPAGVGARNPVFDVTPAELVDCIVTERGVVERPTAEGLRRLSL